MNYILCDNCKFHVDVKTTEVILDKTLCPRCRDIYEDEV